MRMRSAIGAMLPPGIGISGLQCRAIQRGCVGPLGILPYSVLSECVGPYEGRYHIQEVELYPARLLIRRRVSAFACAHLSAYTPK
eukprot:2893730-Rhodomonas_salina.3